MREPVLGKPMTPYFRTAKRDETVVDYAKTLLRRCTNHKVGRFQIFDLDWRVTADAMAAFPEVLANKQAALSVMRDWGKYSVFRMTNRDRDPDAEWYEMGVVVAKRSALYRNTEVSGEWAVFSNCGKNIPLDASVDLTNADTTDLKSYADIGVMAAMVTMRAILDRPTEYWLSKGERTQRERMLNIPAVVTISLSKPVIQTIGRGEGGGWKMPEHDVRGHERRLKSGKVVWVTGHKRGDASVQRRTTYRVIP